MEELEERKDWEHQRGAQEPVDIRGILEFDHLLLKAMSEGRCMAWPPAIN